MSEDDTSSGFDSTISSEGTQLYDEYGVSSDDEDLRDTSTQPHPWACLGPGRWLLVPLSGRCYWVYLAAVYVPGKQHPALQFQMFKLKSTFQIGIGVPFSPFRRHWHIGMPFPDKGQMKRPKILCRFCVHGDVRQGAKHFYLHCPVRLMTMLRFVCKSMCILLGELPKEHIMFMYGHLCIQLQSVERCHQCYPPQHGFQLGFQVAENFEWDGLFSPHLRNLDTWGPISDLRGP